MKCMTFLWPRSQCEGQSFLWPRSQGEGQSIKDTKKEKSRNISERDSLDAYLRESMAKRADALHTIQ